MAENKFKHLTTSLEHSISGTLNHENAVTAVPVVATLPSGIQNEIVFVEVSGQLCIFTGGAWRCRQGSGLGL